MNALILLVVAIVLFAALLVSHAALLLAVFRSEESTGLKALSLFPLATPVLAWRAKATKRVIAWAVLLVAYVVVRVVA